MASVFLKILKIGFQKPILFFFGGFSIIWTTYSPSLASGKQFLPIEKKHFSKKKKLLFFLKTTDTVIFLGYPAIILYVHAADNCHH